MAEVLPTKETQSMPKSHNVVETDTDFKVMPGNKARGDHNLAHIEEILSLEKELAKMKQVSTSQLFC